jgi:hypothetical protein
MVRLLEIVHITVNKIIKVNFRILSDILLSVLSLMIESIEYLILRCLYSIYDITTCNIKLKRTNQLIGPFHTYRLPNKRLKKPLFFLGCGLMVGFVFTSGSN